jgi:hypothetical protein
MNREKCRGRTGLVLLATQPALQVLWFPLCSSVSSVFNAFNGLK